LIILVRIIYYAIDPHNIRLLFPRVLEELIFTIPLLCLALATSMVIEKRKKNKGDKREMIEREMKMNKERENRIGMK